MQAEMRVVRTSGEQGGGKPPEKPGSGKPGRAHEKEKPVVPPSVISNRHANIRAWRRGQARL